MVFSKHIKKPERRSNNTNLVKNTKITMKEPIVDLVEITNIPGSVLDESDIINDRIMYTMSNLEERAREYGMILFRPLNLHKKNMITEEDIMINFRGDLADLLIRRDNFIKRVALGSSLYITLKDLANKYVKERAQVKKEYIDRIKNIFENGMDITNKVAEAEREYKKKVGAVTEALQKLKDDTKEGLEKEDCYGVGSEKLISNLELVYDGLIIGSNLKCDFPIDDGFVSDIHGIILEKENKLVYSDLSLNPPFIYTFKDFGDGLEWYKEYNGDRILLDIKSKQHQASYIFVGEPKEINTRKGKRIYTKHCICIAKGGKLSSD